jgi:hypothetical protein
MLIFLFRCKQADSVFFIDTGKKVDTTGFLDTGGKYAAGVICAGGVP